MGAHYLEQAFLSLVFPHYIRGQREEDLGIRPSIAFFILTMVQKSSTA
jgi:hypothetical protein